jgi:hypothetical protein
MPEKNQMLIRIFVLFFGFVVAACGGSSDDGPGSGTIEVGIADAPVDNAEAVVIHFTHATLHGPGGNTTVMVYDPVTGNPGRSIDLLRFQGGMWTGLFDDVVTAGQYSWIRLTLDLSQSYIQIAGEPYALRCTSCENNGYKLNRSFEVVANGTQTLMLDFDLRKSITDPSGDDVYILRPTVRVIEVAASGDIEGVIDPGLIEDLGGYNGCSVYAFRGNDAQLDDIYIPIDMPVPDEQNNPISTGKVTLENNIYSYMIPFLPAGDYTVALTCDADMDSAATDDVLTFSVPVNVPVVAGQSSNRDLALPVVTPPVP